MTNTSKKIAYFSLGSNMGDRVAFLKEAEAQIEKHKAMHIAERSQIYETEPWPQHEVSGEHPEAEKGQHWFLNQVLKVETTLEPQALLLALQSIESDIGRTKKEHWGPRNIDIDILLYEDEVIDLPNLTIPHRHMHDRQFILIPLLEITPEQKDPATGKKYRDFLAEIKDNHRVSPFF